MLKFIFYGWTNLQFNFWCYDGYAITNQVVFYTLCEKFIHYLNSLHITDVEGFKEIRKQATSTER